MAEDIRAALEKALRTGDGVQGVVASFYRLANQQDEATKTEMLAYLEAPLRAHSPDRLGHVAMLAGAFVEIGADPRQFPLAVFDHLLDALSAIDGPEDTRGMPEWYFLLERAAMAALSRSAELRRTLPNKSALLAKIRRYQERYGFLGKMLTVLDGEPLVVLHPSLGRGFRFIMHGIADNFQLHLLLLAALAGDGASRIEGVVPSREATAAASNGDSEGKAAVQSTWQLANWSALRPAGEIDREDTKRSWIWNEGVPADIASYEGTRVVLVAPSTIQRGWNAARVFPGMDGSLEGPVQMPQPDVRALLNAMESAAAASA